MSHVVKFESGKLGCSVCYKEGSCLRKQSVR
ncbi:MAG: hypothetical protein RL710_449 [Pseudomonadota bacterium]